MDRDDQSRSGGLKAAAVLDSGAAAGRTRQGVANDPGGRIDAVLRRAVEDREVPGVVAMAASDTDVLYEGAFGSRALGQAAPMTLDTVFRIASMTKAITSVAAMQLVEQGKLALDAPVPAIDPALASPQVLERFDAAGAPVLRPAKCPITLRHLLTHSAGFSYETWNPDVGRYVRATGMPSTGTGRIASLRLPLVFDPGERWEYGINIDWVGRIVEEVGGQRLDAYFRDRIFAPLGMADTGFVPSAEQRMRQASVHQRNSDGGLEAQPLDTPSTPEFWAGGGGLYSTAPDYIRFVRMLLNAGSLDGARVLKPETVALMNRNHLGDLPAGLMKTAMPDRSNDVDFFPGQDLRWGLGYMLSQQPGPNGRSAGSVTWAGIFNSYYWVDPARRIGGVIMTQILPFADHAVVGLYGRFERAVYDMTSAG
ncbi:MAG: beta-lactamase family protein [Alphaproteobacteria bacterium]|nr:beta-lactamase family protein [Alphaproteobacteria bacterium]